MLNKTFCKLSAVSEIKELKTSSSWHIIDLSHNSIKFIDSPDLLRQQNDLTKLQLNSNSDFNGRGDEQILAHKTLSDFECNECGFTEIQSQHFAGLVSLSRLDLRANKIDRINVNAFKLNGNLNSVDLTNNRLKSLPHSTFVGLRHFETLRLSSNRITLPASQSFLKSESLKHLRLDECDIAALYTETFSELRVLETLDLNRNLIESLPVNSFKLNLGLKSLFAESNRMRFFPLAVLDYLEQLTELCIDNNTFVKSAEMNKLVERYNERNLRSDACNSDVELYVENLAVEVAMDVPSPRNNTEKSSSLVVKFKHPGVSDFFLGSYITLIILVQLLALVLLSFYLLKISKYEKLEGEVNYANTILNDDEIYRVYKSNQ
jgi:Leucine-rich repeat (LRR) protein